MKGDLELWLAENREVVSAMVEEGWQSAKRGELFTEDEVRAHMQERKRIWLEKQSLSPAPRS